MMRTRWTKIMSEWLKLPSYLLAWCVRCILPGEIRLLIVCILYIILYSQSGIEHVHVQYKTYKEKKIIKKYTNNWQFPVQIVQDMYHNSVKSPQ